MDYRARRKIVNNIISGLKKTKPTEKDKVRIYEMNLEGLYLRTNIVSDDKNEMPCLIIKKPHSGDVDSCVPAEIRGADCQNDVFKYFEEGLEEILIEGIVKKVYERTGRKEKAYHYTARSTHGITQPGKADITSFDQPIIYAQKQMNKLGGKG